GIGSREAAPDRGHRLVENRPDAIGQLAAIVFGPGNAAARQGVLIAAATGPKEGKRAGVSLFQVQLREAGIVTRPEVKAQYRRMAGVAADKRPKTTVRVPDGEYG